MLTPRGKRLQEGSRAVARQLTTDILPFLVPPPGASPLSSKSSSARRTAAAPNVDLNKVGNRILNAVSNRLQSDLGNLQKDLANPRRIPARLSQQSYGLLQEATNVFAETPAGLQEPAYTVVAQTAAYEIRDYAAYTVASTNMRTVEESGDTGGALENPALQGAAFNSLAAYIFGANRQQEVLPMTTPVTTTACGEMRFYLATSTSTTDENGNTVEKMIPEPLEQDEARSVYETDRILIQEIPPARLAVRRFPGFATNGEIRRQKQALLTVLALDEVELDVPHGAAVPHVVFQYNPPYTLPVVRRNEIAVAVRDASAQVEGWEA